MPFNEPMSGTPPDWMSAFASSFNLPNFESTSLMESQTPSTSSDKNENPKKTTRPKTTPRKIRSYTISQKLEVIGYAKEHSISAANRKYNIDRKCIRDWRKNEAALMSVQSGTSATTDKKRRPGAGRRVMDREFDSELANWLKAELGKGRNPSRSEIQWKALEMAQQRGVDTETEFKASTGWLEKFLIRHNFRSNNSGNDHPSKNIVDKLDNQPLKNQLSSFVDRQKQLNGYNDVYLVYKMDLFVDAEGRLVKDENGELPNTTGKLHLILTVSNEGQKLPPFLELPASISKQQHLQSIAEENNIHLNFNDDTNSIYLNFMQKTFGETTKQKRLLLWNEFGCELSDQMNRFLTKTEINNVLIPTEFTDAVETINTTLRHQFFANLFTQLATADQPLSETSTSSNNLLSPNYLNITSVSSAWQLLDISPIVRLFRSVEVDANLIALGFNTSNTSAISLEGEEMETIDEYRDEYARFLDKIVESIGGDSSNDSLFGNEGS